MGIGDITAFQTAEAVLKEYRTLDCSCCNKFFGFIHRKRGTIFCSSSCVSAGEQPGGHNNIISPALTPLTPQQVMAITSHVGCDEADGFVHPSRESFPKRENSVTFRADLDEQKKNPFGKKHEQGAPASKLVPDIRKEEVPRSKEVRKETDTPRSKPAPEVQKQDQESSSEPKKNPFGKKEEAPRTKPVPELRKEQDPPRSRSTPEVQKQDQEHNIEPKRNPFGKKQEQEAPRSKPTLEVHNQEGESSNEPQRNPFGKKEQEAPCTKPAPEVHNQDSEPQRNPFGKKQEQEAPRTKPTPETRKDQDTLSSKPVSEVRKQEVGSLSETKRNPLPNKEEPKAPVKKVAETKVREITVPVNEVVLKLRSALGWTTGFDESFGKIVKGVKSNDNGPVDFYFQTTAMIEKLTKLQLSIKKFVDEGKPKPLKRLELGQLVFAPYTGEFFRGEIIAIPRADVAEVFFIDYGNTIDIPRTELTVLDKQFHEEPRLCAQCQWDFWLTKEEKDVDDTITARYHSTDNNGLIPLQRLTDGQYIVAIGPKIEAVKFSVGPFFKFDRVPLDMGHEEERPVPPFDKPASLRKKYWFKNLEYSSELQEGNLIKVGYIWNYLKYMVSAVDDLSKMSRFQLDLNEYVSTAKRLKNRPDIDEVVLAPYSESYYRARVVAHDEKDVVIVMFFDFGDKTAIKFNELCEPSEKLMQHPIYALNVQLHDIPDTNEGRNVILDEATHELLGDPLQLQINKPPEGDGDIYVVTLWREDETLNEYVKCALKKALGK